MILIRLAPVALLVLAACGASETNPPTDPAPPILTPESEVPAMDPAPASGVGAIMPGAGPTSFVGRWAADRAWCANPRGAERPIEISTTRFEGYENSCGILTVSQVADGYEAGLACSAEGETSRERVRMSVQGDAMQLTWLNRNGAVVSLFRCPTPRELAGAPPS